MSDPRPASGPAADEPRRAFRDTRHPVAGGVAGGLALHLGLPVTWVRVAFVVLAAMGGLGVALYAALWVFLPTVTALDAAAPGLESASRDGRRPGPVRRLADVGPAFVIGALALAAVLGVEAIFGEGALFWPVVVGLAGLVLLWRQADEAQRERWLDSSGRIDPFRAVFGSGGWASYARVVAGALLIVVALGIFALGAGPFQVAGDILVAAGIGVVGLALVVVPWAIRLVDDLAAERTERVRTQERADVAAHLHDSVLQTLALIQKNAGSPTTVARLARAQERDLRSWLFDAAPPGEATVVGALRATAAQVEDAHGVAVDVVNVGDSDLTEALRPVVDASREAITNAAKHAGAERIDVFAEVGGGAVDVFVRDRGVGFETRAVPADRLGVRESILGRMERHGGQAEVRSAPGEGTEVWLHLPLAHDRAGIDESEGGER
ncbi:MAG TPA: PspC domain-containing protein [Nocardioides sp.]